MINTSYKKERNLALTLMAVAPAKSNPDQSGHINNGFMFGLKYIYCFNFIYSLSSMACFGGILCVHWTGF